MSENPPRVRNNYPLGLDKDAEQKSNTPMLPAEEFAALKRRQSQGEPMVDPERTKIYINELDYVDPTEDPAIKELRAHMEGLSAKNQIIQWNAFAKTHPEKMAAYADTLPELVILKEAESLAKKSAELEEVPGAALPEDIEAARAKLVEQIKEKTAEGEAETLETSEVVEATATPEATPAPKEAEKPAEAPAPVPEKTPAEPKKEEPKKTPEEEAKAKKVAEKKFKDMTFDEKLGVVAGGLKNLVPGAAAAAVGYIALSAIINPSKFFGALFYEGLAGMLFSELILKGGWKSIVSDWGSALGKVSIGGGGGGGPKKKEAKHDDHGAAAAHGGGGDHH